MGLTGGTWFERTWHALVPSRHATLGSLGLPELHLQSFWVLEPVSGLQSLKDLDISGCVFRGSCSKVDRTFDEMCWTPSMALYSLPNSL